MNVTETAGNWYHAYFLRSVDKTISFINTGTNNVITIESSFYILSLKFEKTNALIGLLC
jgi:hypothetical protein